MRIAMLAPLWKELPPKKYGGTELVTSLLTEELIRQGHQVTLYACGGTKTQAELVEVIDRPLFDILGEFRFDAIQYQDLIAISKVFNAAKEGHYDIIHNHMGLYVAALANVSPVPMLTTNHSSVAPDFEPLSKYARDSNYISISNAQRRLAPYLNYVDTVYHGIRTEDIEPNYHPDDYLLFLATMSKEKGVDRAIEIAQKTNHRLIMAGDIRDIDYFNAEVKPLIDGNQIQYLGEVDAQAKNDLMKKAKAYLFPIRWNEAFGLTIAESLAAGTPVIAYPNGSAPELITDGETGYLVTSIDEAVEALSKIDFISRKVCREQAVKRFDVSVMANHYLEIYRKLKQ